MYLDWRKEEDGVIVVFAVLSDGRQYDVADFWLRTMVNKLGISRQVSEDYQCQFVNLLVSSHNRLTNNNAQIATPSGLDK